MIDNDRLSLCVVVDRLLVDMICVKVLSVGKLLISVMVCILLKFFFFLNNLFVFC